MENRVDYNIDERLVQQFRSTLTSEQVITKKDSNKKYIIEDANLSSEFDLGVEVKVENFLIKIKKLRSKDNLTSYLPVNKILDNYEGFTPEQLSILEEINKQVRKVEIEREETKEQEKIIKRQQIQRSIEEDKKTCAEIEAKKKSLYNRAKFLVNELEIKKFQDKFDRLTKDDVDEIIKIIKALEPFYEDKKKKEEEKENALKLEKVDLIDEDNRKVSIDQWFNLYKKAQEYGDIRDLYESRAIIVNSILYCNAARALIANNAGSIDKETGERTGKEGNKLYKICQTGGSYCGLYARLAEPAEIDSWVSNIYGDEWSELISER